MGIRAREDICGYMGNAHGFSLVVAIWQNRDRKTIETTNLDPKPQTPNPSNVPSKV